MSQRKPHANRGRPLRAPTGQNPPAATSSTSLLLTVASCALLVLAVSMVYARGVHAPLVYDDRSSLEENESIRSLWPLTTPLGPAKDTPVSGRPLVNLTFAVNYSIGGLEPYGYHVVNIAIHAISACLLFLVVRRTLAYLAWTGPNDLIAFAAALLWALHPLNTEAVQYITQRTELMVALFYLATLYGSQRYWAASTPSARTLWGAFATLACASGMASKEVMVTAPLVVLLYERTFVVNSFAQALRRSWPLYAGLASTWLVLAYLNYDRPRALSTGFDHDIRAHVWWFSQSKVLWMYLKLVVWPWPLNICYEMPYLDTIGGAWPWLLPVAALAAATVVLVARRSTVGFVLACTFLILSPTLIVPIATEIAAERRMYLPLAAIVAAIVLVADRSVRSLPNASAIVVAFALSLSVVMGAVASHRLSCFDSPESLWRDSVERNPNNSQARNNLGTSLVKLDRLDEAIEQFQDAIRINPRYVPPYNNLAVTLSRRDRLDEALAYVEIAKRLEPDNFDTWYNAGVLLKAANRPTEAIAAYQEAARLREDNPSVHNNLANALHSVGDVSSAIEHFERCLELSPNKANARFNYAGALRQAGRIPEAIVQYHEALRIEPNLSVAHLNLADLLLSEGQVREAVTHFEQGLSGVPNSLAAYNRLADAYAKLGEHEKAIATAERALAVARSTGQQEAAQQIQAWVDEYRTTHKSPTLPP